MVASLILGSHVMHNSFAMIALERCGDRPRRWERSLVESVAAEVIVFVAVGHFCCTV